LVLTEQDVIPLIKDVETMIRGKCLRQKVKLDMTIPEKLPSIR